MHTAEHLLNQSVTRLLGCGRAFSSHIERKRSKCDYRFGRDLTGAERTALEEMVNGAIRAGLAVTEEFMTRGEAATRFDLKRLPEGAGDRLRLVRIGDYDACPCIGPHAASTKELGTFRIVSTGYSAGVLRIRFRLDPAAAQ